MVAWKRAVITGERKAVARGGFQPEQLPGDLRGVNPLLSKKGGGELRGYR